MSLRDQFRTELVWLQEEMDWLVYSAYGLLPLECGGKRSATPLSLGTECLSASSQSAVAANALPAHSILPLAESERPFRFRAKANGDFSKAVAKFLKKSVNDESIPAASPLEKSALSAAARRIHCLRLDTTRTNQPT